jgi:hypothetical protein
MRQIEQALKIAPGCLEKKNSHGEGQDLLPNVMFSSLLRKIFYWGLSTVAFTKSNIGRFKRGGKFLFL